MDNVSSFLSKNIISLRRIQGLSQIQLATIASIPRSTLTYIESGEGNPTLANIVKVATALKVSIEELISEPSSSEYRHIPASEISQKILGAGQVIVQKLLPDPIPGMEIDRITLLPVSKMKGTPHIKNTKEYLYCSQGLIEVYINKQVFKIAKGDLFRFPGDRPHAYVNPSKTKTAIGFSVVAFNPM